MTDNTEETIINDYVYVCKIFNRNCYSEYLPIKGKNEGEYIIDFSM